MIISRTIIKSPKFDKKWYFSKNFLPRSHLKPRKFHPNPAKNPKIHSQLNFNFFFKFDPVFRFSFFYSDENLQKLNIFLLSSNQNSLFPHPRFAQSVNWRHWMILFSSSSILKISKKLYGFYFLGETNF